LRKIDSRAVLDVLGAMEQMGKSIGQIAFEAYREAVGKVAYDGTLIPEWEEVADKVRIGWAMAAQAVIEYSWTSSIESILDVEEDA